MDKRRFVLLLSKTYKYSFKMNKELKEHIEACLQSFKNNIKVEQELYQLGVNLLNCKINDYNPSIDLIKFLLSDTSEYSMVDWWLYDKDLYLYNSDKTVFKDLSDVRSFVEYMTSKERNLDLNFNI